MSSNFAPITEEQREQAKQQRLIDQEFARNNLKINYVDQPHWTALASKYNCKLPGWWYPMSDVKYMRRVAKKNGVNMDDFLETTGFSSLKEFAFANSNMTAVAGVGFLLEWLDEGIGNDAENKK
jgi:hypothetical protein